MRLFKKVVAITLVMMMLITMQQGAFIVLADETVQAINSAEKVEIPLYIPEDAEDRDKHVKRLKEDEDEYTFVFENEDGTISVYSFADAVQYYDEDGNLVDYDPRLTEVKNDEKKNAGYAYEVTSSDVKIMFPSDVVTGKYFTVEKDKYKIDFKPITEFDNSKKVKDEDKDKTKDEYKAKDILSGDDIAGMEYLSAESDKIKYKYYSTTTGIKEDIILEAPPESNVMQFEIKVKNVVPVINEYENVVFVDEDTLEQVGAISPFFMYDAIQEEYEEGEVHFSENIEVKLEQEKNNKSKYILTVYLDDGMLYSENTVYPVVIDPTLTIKSLSADSYVCSGIPTKNYNGSVYLLVGPNSGKTYRSFVKYAFPSTYEPYEIEYAIYYAKINTDYSETYGSLCRIYRVTESWSSNQITWSNQPGYDSSYSRSKTIYGKGSYAYDITKYVRDWALYEMSDGVEGYPNYGFTIRAADESYWRYFRYFSSDENGWYRPYTLIKYKQDNEEPNAVAKLRTVTGEDPINNGKATITFDWDGTTDNSSGDPEGVKEYELTLQDTLGNFYNADGTMTTSSPPEEYIPEIIPHDDRTTPYTKEFVNLPDNTTYIGKIRACDDMSASPLIDDHWSDYTLSDAIVIDDIEEVTFAINPNDWTDDQTPTITWSGIADAEAVEYSVDSGTWTDSGLLGSAGSGDLPSLGLSDGQYQIKVRGMDTTTSTPTPESSEITYKFDMTAPTVDISSPSDGGTIGESVDILGSVLDSASGVANWTLEYNDGSEPITWNEIATGTEAINQGQSISTWDTSSLGVGDYTVRLTATDVVGHNSVDEEITLTKPIAYTLTTPTNLNATADVNYMMTVNWEDGINPSGTTYAVYRDYVDTFTPDAANLVAEGLDNTYWYDFDVEIGNSYYYKVIASYDMGGGMVQYSNLNPTTVSNEGTLTVASEVSDKLGLQNFWKFTSFSAGNGTGYINVANGNLVYNSTDSVFPGYMLAMVMRRTYNSQSDVKTSLGYGWDFSYNTRLYKENDSGEGDVDLILKDGDGSLHYFDHASTASGVSTYTAPAGVFMELTYTEATDEYTIKRKDDITYTFNGYLELVKLTELNGNYLKFNYDQSGRLNSVENYDANDNNINQAYLTYYESTDTGVDPAHVGLLAQIIDESNRTYKYEYVAGNAYLKKAYLDIAGTTNDYKEEYTYAAGTHNLASVKDTINNTTSITYLGGGKVNTVTYPDSKYFTLTYNTGISKALFDSTSLTLDTTTVTDSWGHSTEYAYDNFARVRVTTNALDDTTEFDYNNDLQVTAVRYENTVGSSTTPTTIGTTIAYNTDGNITSITDADSHTTSITYDTTFINKVKTVTAPINSTTNAVTTNTYYADGNLKYTTDAEGNVTEYTYTADGLIESVTNHVGSTITAVGSKTQYSYYTNGWLNEVRQGSKNDSTLTLMSKVVQYDAQGNPAVTQDAMGNKSKVEYDALGRPVKTYLPDRDTQETTQDWTNNEYTTAVYDLKGRATSAIDIKGTVTNIAYDNMDRLTSTTQVVATGNIVSSVEYTDYEKSANNTCLKMIATNPEGAKTIEYYDELGRVIKTAVSYGTTDVEIETNELIRAEYEYDIAGNVISSKGLISADGTEYTETTFEYDKLNRQTKSKTYNDAGELVSTTTAYNYVGNATSVTDPQNYVTYYYYDKIGRLTRVKDGGYSTYYSFDNIKSYGGTNYLMNKITNPKGHVKETYLDAFGYPVVEIDQGDPNTTSVYRAVERTFNDNGTVDNVKQADNQVDYYTYNNWGQATFIKYGSSTSTDNETAYTYNAHGQMSTMTDRRTDTLAGGVAQVTTSWTYDTIGRTTSATQDGTTIQYDYDKAGNVTKVEQPSDDTGTEITNYNYNGYGQLESVDHNSEKIRDYIYLATGEMDKTVDYMKFDESDTTTTMSTEYSFTKLGQLSELKYVKDSTSTTIEKYNYSYDKRGNILSETLYNSYSSTSLTKSYVYDSLNRLTKSTFGSDETTYTYDSVNNRTSEKSRQTDEYYDKYHYYNEFDQLERVTTNIDHGAVDTERYTYNARGAISYADYKLYNELVIRYYPFVDPETGETIYLPVEEYEYPQGTPWLGTSYTYDKAGRIQKTVEELDVYTTETVGHFYNGMEQRVRKVKGSDTTKYIYSGSALLYTTDANNAKLTEHILAPSGQIIASQRFDGSYDGNYYFYNQDIRNSTMSILSDSFSAVKYYKYNEYGKQTTQGNSSFINDNTYTGAVAEGDNIFYMNARFYDANNGRFLTQDTYKGNAWEPWSQNLYTYTGNNPINYIDPTGHSPLPLQHIDGSGGISSEPSSSSIMSSFREEEDQTLVMTNLLHNVESSEIYKYVNMLFEFPAQTQIISFFPNESIGSTSQAIQFVRDNGITDFMRDGERINSTNEFVVENMGGIATSYIPGLSTAYNIIDIGRGLSSLYTESDVLKIMQGSNVEIGVYDVIIAQTSFGSTKNVSMAFFVGESYPFLEFEGSSTTRGPAVPVVYAYTCSVSTVTSQSMFGSMGFGDYAYSPTTISYTTAEINQYIYPLE